MLRCDSIAEAEATAAGDPYSVHGIYEAETVEWDLVGIDPSLIDRTLVH